MLISNLPIAPIMFSSGHLLYQRYQLQQILGQTPSRQTWLATDQQSQDAVVVKILTFGGPMEWQDLKLFEREAQVLHQLDHPHIPKYRDHFSRQDPPAWFASIYTYIPGKSLKELLDQNRRFSETELRKIAIDVLKILIYLHGLTPQILHRDIKPSNLIWGEDGEIYVVDFGAVQTQAYSPGRTFTIVGTYGYTPVEQYGGQAIPASDLYALGATVIHLATGQAPTDLPCKEMRLQFQDRIRSQVDGNSSMGLEPSFISWLERLVEPMVEYRIQTAQDALHRLESRQIFPWRSPSSLTQPVTSLIRLQRTTDYLWVMIPSMFHTRIGAKRTLTSMTPTEISALAGVSLALVLSLLAFPLLICVLMILGYLLMIGLQETEIVLTRYHLEIKHRIFDWAFFRKRICVKEIEDVFRERMATGRSDQDQKSFRLVLRTIHGDEVYIGTQWTGREECLWLNREISSWLESC